MCKDYIRIGIVQSLSPHRPAPRVMAMHACPRRVLNSLVIKANDANPWTALREATDRLPRAGLRRCMHAMQAMRIAYTPLTRVIGSDFVSRPLENGRTLSILGLSSIHEAFACGSWYLCCDDGHGVSFRQHYSTASLVLLI